MEYWEHLVRSTAIGLGWLIDRAIRFGLVAALFWLLFQRDSESGDSSLDLPVAEMPVGDLFAGITVLAICVVGTVSVFWKD